MLSFFLSYLLLYKYILIFLIIGAASFGFPLPATAILMAAGAFAAEGYFDIENILISGFLASILGDILNYSLSFRYGKKLFSTLGLDTLLISPKFSLVEKLFTKHTASAIFFSRFLATGLGPIINILSGLSKIPPKKFIAYDIFGEGIYVLIFGGLGYAFGSEWEAISSISGDVTAIFVLLIVLLVFIYILLQRRHKKAGY